MTHLVGKMTKTWQITLSYVLVLIIGFLFGNSTWSATNTLSNLKLLCEVLFPVATLVVACIGLQSWKKAERFKIKYKLATEVIEKVKEQNKQCVQAASRFNRTLGERERVGKDGTLEKLEFLTPQFEELDLKHILLAEIYRNYFDELYILDKELLEKVNQFLIFNLPLSDLYIDVNYRDQPEQLYDARLERLKIQCEYRASIYKHLLEIAAS